MTHAFEWPHVVQRIVTLIVLLGVPVAATLAWYQGHRAQRRVSGQELAVLTVLLVVGGSVLWWVSRHSHEPIAAHQAGGPAVTAAPDAGFHPPPHSVAVLPFVNISGDKEQEYFSDGLTEEILNSLARLSELQVSARTSSFSFKGKDTDIGAIARKLNVASMLEGSVRRAGNTVRITAQLNNAVTGFHLWSQTYDRDLKDILQLQTEIANAVASALKVTLLGDVAEKIEVGGTRNPKAFDAYLRGRRINWENEHDLQEQIANYNEAIRLDPQYALAYAARSSAYRANAQFFTPGPVLSSDGAAKYAQALADARQSLALAPDLPEGYVALATYFMATLHSAEAKEAVDHAVTLAPSDARALRAAGYFYTNIGQVKTGLAMTEKGLARDPVNPDAYSAHGWALYGARRYAEALPVLERAVELDGKGSFLTGMLGIVRYVVGDYSGAATSCEVRPDYWMNRVCLAISYDKLGRHADAAAIRAREQADAGDGDAYEYAQIDAQWGNRSKALDWLDTATRVRDAGLLAIKTDPLMDPLRNEPRFQATERALKFPD
jgi:TolB-like protein